MSRLRLAIVGCGSITERGLLPHLMLERDLVEITALCDISEARLEMLAGKFDVPKTFVNLSDLLRSAEAEAIAIATPISLHYGQAREALLQSRHVYVQKTMTQTAEEAQELARLANERGLALAASPGQMLLPAFIRARELVESGVLGSISETIGVNMAPGHEEEPLRKDAAQDSEGIDPSWYYRKGGGPLRDMGVYSLHAIVGILGEARAVMALANRSVMERRWKRKRIPVEVYDSISLSLRFEKNGLAQVIAAFSANPPALRWGDLTISGSKGSLTVRPLPDKSWCYELLLTRSGATSPEREEFGTGLDEKHDALDEAHVARDLLDFVEAVRDRRFPRASAEAACHVIEIIEAAEKAAETGSVVEIPPKYKKAALTGEQRSRE